MGGINLWKEAYKADIAILIFIASKSRLYGTTILTTSRLASEFGLSQQSASRKLHELEEKGLIKRTTTNSGIIVKLTQESISLLKKISEQFSGLFNSNLIFRGYISKGLGEGKYYMKREGYTKSFNNLFGYIPWPGTLNIKLKAPISKEALDEISPIVINGFKEKERSFGSLKCYPCIILDDKILLDKNSTEDLNNYGFCILNNIPKSMVKNIKAYLIRPERNNYSEDILEIIAPNNLRDELNLQDHDQISFSIKI